jgi:hypothetical protein
MTIGEPSAGIRGAQESDWFYHWGGLLGMVALIEAGVLGAPEEPLQGAARDPIMDSIGGPQV